MNEKQQTFSEYFERELPRLVGDIAYYRKFVVIAEISSGVGIADVKDAFGDALSSALEKFPSGDFIIQEVVGKDEVVSFIMAAV